MLNIFSKEHSLTRQFFPVFEKILNKMMQFSASSQCFLASPLFLPVSTILNVGGKTQLKVERRSITLENRLRGRDMKPMERNLLS